MSRIRDLSAADVVEAVIKKNAGIGSTLLKVLGVGAGVFAAGKGLKAGKVAIEGPDGPGSKVRPTGDETSTSGGALGEWQKQQNKRIAETDAAANDGV